MKTERERNRIRLPLQTEETGKMMKPSVGVRNSMGGHALQGEVLSLGMFCSGGVVMMINLSTE